MQLVHVEQVAPRPGAVEERDLAAIALLDHVVKHGPQGRHARSATDEDGLRGRLAQAELPVGPDDFQLVADAHALLQVAREEATRATLFRGLADPTRLSCLLA